MEILINYYKELGLFAIVSAVVLFVVAVIALVFFAKRKNVVCFLFVFLYGLLVYVAHVCNKLFESKLEFTEYVLNFVTVFLIVALVIAYRSDIKTIITKMGKMFDKDNFFKTHTTTEDEIHNTTNEIVKATQSMAKNNVGALIIIDPKGVLPSSITDTGTKLNAIVSESLLESIFITSGPLHDGAVVISGTNIVAAGCFLTLTMRTDLAKDLGTRHRAAIGVTEEADVLSIVVSEETGVISVSYGGVIKRYLTPSKLASRINEFYEKGWLGDFEK